MRTNNSMAQWRAILERDPAEDNRFVFAVITTGIYCRPTCPSRRPKRENTRFYDSCTAAKKAGYRACKRCAPDCDSLVRQRVDLVQRVCRIIEASEASLRLSELANAVGVSSSHLHRQFKSVMGLTPKEYGRGIRVQKLQTQLRQEGTVTDAIYAAGYGSGSRVYETADQTLGMTPGNYRLGGKGHSIVYAFADSPLGKLLVAATDQGVCCIEIDASKKTLREGLKTRFPQANLCEDEQKLKKWLANIVRYIKAPGGGLSLPLDIQGSAFQRLVWQALQAIPLGETMSYQDLAVAVGKPKAQRAVAQACAANKIALAIPCHRVVRSNGDLGGYHWGVEVKEKLLETEKQCRQEAK